MRTLCVFILCILCAVTLHAQQSPDLLFQHLDYRNGLSDPSIQSLSTDRRGFLWIGTHNGLNRFDGTNCIPIPLEGNMISRLYDSPQGEKYVGTQKGLSRYLEQKGSFEYIPFEGWQNYYANPFYLGDKLWCNVAGGIFVKDSTFRFITDKTNGRSYVGSTHNGKIKWLITNASQAGVFVHYIGDKEDVVESKAYFREGLKIQPSDIYVAGDSLVWITSDKGLFQLNPHTGAYRQFEIGVALSCLTPYKNGLFLISNGAGIFFFDFSEQKVVRQYKHQFHREGSLSGDQISKIHIDDFDNMYVAVLGKGLDYTNLRQVQFTHLLDKESSVQLKVDNDITAILEMGDGTLWCGTRSDGILVLKGGVVRGRLLPRQAVRGLYKTFNGDIFIASDKQKNYIYTAANARFTPWEMPELLENIGYSVLDPKTKGTLLCTAQGVVTLNKKFLKTLNSSVEWKNISHMVFLDSNEVLVQTYYTNLSLAVREGDDFKVQKEIARTPFNVNASVKVGDNVYLATTSGLYRYRNEHLEQLSSAYCTDVLYQDGKLWLNTNNGLHTYYIRTGILKKYTEIDGLQGAIFNAHTLTLTKDEQIYTAGTNGLNGFDPKKIRSSSHQIKAYITRVSINDHVLPETNPITLENLDLNYKSNTVSFQLTPLDFLKPHEIRMTYQLLGFDQSPIAANGVTEVRYARLPPGEYVLRVEVEGNQTATELPIRITPPFWRTYWFIALVVFGIIAITIASTYWFGRWVKNNQLEKMRIMLSSQEEERKRIAVDLHDDLGGRLSSLKLYMQASARGISEEQRATFRDTTRLLDEAISELRNILFNLSPKTLDENGLEAAVVDLGRNIEKITGLKVETNIDTGGLKLGRPVQYALYRITQELINNTLKHSKAVAAYISLINREDGLVFLYEDNGKGFIMEEIKMGYGLTNIKTHAQAIFADLTIDTSPGKGLALTLIIPKDTLIYEPQPL
jgi:signal transduction histidine kinase/ligand-binding sensor domain-containing protein